MHVQGGQPVPVIIYLSPPPQMLWVGGHSDADLGRSWLGHLKITHEN